LTIEWCDMLRALPTGMSKLGALKQLALGGLHELQEIPDLIGLTALGSWTIGCCVKLRALPRRIGKLALREPTLHELDELQEIPDVIGLTALGSLTISLCDKLRALLRGIGERLLTASSSGRCRGGSAS
jgi:hypothetical protein